jgi:peptidoglycan/xylan/chitin deacetylase (PgdA/CDA1 family)
VPTPFLMYHELATPGRRPCEDGPGYLRYVVDSRTFAGHLDWLAARRMHVCGVGEACRRGLETADQVVITFDDGCETDAEIAAPLLAERGFGATFFVVSSWVGRRRGFMHAGQLRGLHQRGFEVGSHSDTHAFLSDLGPAELHRELRDSRRALEDSLGAPVRHLSCPGGRWSARVASAAREAGYDTVSTSRLGVNGRDDGGYSLARCAILRETTLRRFESLCRGTQPWGTRIHAALLDGAKRTLGNRLYVGLRNAALRER